MMNSRARVVVPAVIVMFVMGGAAAGALAVASGGAHKDTFHGRITSATGHYNHRHGRVWLRLGTPAPIAPARPVTIRVDARRCLRATGCVRLHGTLAGTLTALPGTVPDAGKSFRIDAAGTLHPLGHVTATGAVHGTGFIYEGRELMTLTVTSAHGRVALTLRSGLVPGFTSP